VAVSTWDLARDLADQPMKFINKLALSLPGARNFFLSYVLLQGLGIMPLQLVQLAVILPRWFYRIFFTRTPRGESGRLSRAALRLMTDPKLLRFRRAQHSAHHQPRHHLPPGPPDLPHLPYVLGHFALDPPIRSGLLWDGIPGIQGEPACPCSSVTPCQLD
jgi:hypothetical protein